MGLFLCSALDGHTHWCVGDAMASEPTQPSPRPVFTATAKPGEFEFDTGLLRGKLRPNGKSLGLSSIVHVPSGRKLDRSNGWLGHYRVFTTGTRYGGGAWDWPSAAKLLPGGAVRVDWPAAEGRPFELSAVYRWAAPGAIDVETTVSAQRDLAGFESFLASYFDPAFTNALVMGPLTASSAAQPTLAAAERAQGDWQMFPRDAAYQPLITDGRWKLEPNPVEWTVRPAPWQPIGVRRDPASGLTAVLMAPATDCFAIATPHQTEGHFSMYLSLFGRSLRAGETAKARARLVLLAAPSNQEILSLYNKYLQGLK